MDSRITIFTGHFGSGKTELAVNYALKLSAEGKKTTIVDADIVNTYFRTHDKKVHLTGSGINVIAPEFANTNLDMPTLPAEVLSVFADKEAHIVFDVGGDEGGAYALGGYKRFFDREPYDMLFVINKSRPLTQNADDISAYIADIQNASRLKITGLVNNTNLSHDTDLQVLMDGQAVVEAVSQRQGIPIKYISGKKEIVQLLPGALKEKAFGMDLYFQLPFSG